jgi:hypothetical protein
MRTGLEDIERQQRIGAKAHAIWEQQGRPEGKDLEHWRRAKRLIDTEDLRATAAALDAALVHDCRMKVYFDNVIVSGRVREDLSPKEIRAVEHLMIAEEGSILEIVTCREAWQAQESIRNPAERAECETSPPSIPMVRHNHGLLRIERQRALHRGLAAQPLPIELVDAPLFVELANAGLKPLDARHLMYAVANRCHRFVTLGADFDSCPALRTLCRGLLIVKPSDLSAEILADFIGEVAEESCLRRSS